MSVQGQTGWWVRKGSCLVTEEGRITGGGERTKNSPVGGRGGIGTAQSGMSGWALSAPGLCCEHVRAFTRLS